MDDDTNRRDEEIIYPVPAPVVAEVDHMNKEVTSNNSSSISDDDDINLVEEIEKITSYRFNNADLLEQAFTNFSDNKNRSKIYKIFEFVGDSVFNFVVSILLVSPFNLNTLLENNLNSGKLTQLRAANVDTERLARVAVKFGFHRFFKHKNPLLEQQIEEFKRGILNYPIHSFGLIDTPKVLADMVESFVGALFFDCKLSSDTDSEDWIYTAAKVVKKLLEPMITTDTMKMHPVTKLQELCQKKGWDLNFDKNGWKNNGKVEVYIEDELVGIGEYIPKTCIAKNRAAHDAYNKICSQKLTFLKKSNVTSKYHHDHHPRNNDDHDDEEDNDGDDNRISINEKKNEDHRIHFYHDEKNDRDDKRDSPPINNEDHHIHYDEKNHDHNNKSNENHHIYYHVEKNLNRNNKRDNPFVNKKDCHIHDDEKNHDLDDKRDDHPLVNKEDRHVHDDEKNYDHDDDNRISTDEKRDEDHHIHHHDDKKNHDNDDDNRILTDEKNEYHGNKKDNPSLIDKKDHHVHHDDEKNQKRNYNSISVDKKRNYT